MISWRSAEPEALFLREALLSLAAARPSCVEAARRIRHWDRFLELARRLVVSETVWAALLLRGITDVVPEPWRGSLEDEHAQALARNVLLLREATSVQEALGADGIESVVIKGPGLVLAHYPSLGARHISDIDVLVNAADASRADAILRARGAVDVSGVDFTGKEGASNSPDHLPPLRTAVGAWVEIHFAVPGGEGFSEVAAVFARSRTVSFLERALRIPSMHDLVVMGCLHVFEHHVSEPSYLARQLADLAALSAGSGIDWAGVESNTDPGARKALLAGRSLLEHPEQRQLSRVVEMGAHVPGQIVRLASDIVDAWKKSPRAGIALVFPPPAFLKQRYGPLFGSRSWPLLYLWRPIAALLGLVKRL